MSKEAAIRRLSAGCRQGVFPAEDELGAEGGPDVLEPNTARLACVADPGNPCLKGLDVARFVQSLRDGHVPGQGRAIVSCENLFEVGGRRKSFEQINGLPNSYLAVDDLETGYDNRIPLWMFGLLY